MKVACIQPELFKERKKCYYEIERILKELLEIQQSCQLVCLPERWVPFSRDPAQNFQEQRGNDYNFIKSLAKEYRQKKQ